MKHANIIGAAPRGKEQIKGSLKEITCYFIIVIMLSFMSACHSVISKNKNQIEEVLNSHAATKSLKVIHYDITHYLDGEDTLHVYVKGKYDNNLPFHDTVVIAKN